MSVVLSPVGLAAAPVANQLSTVATYKEKLCSSFCSNQNIIPQVTITYTWETPSLVDTTVFVPVVATISVLTPVGCCKTVPQVYTERFVAAFQGRSALPTSIAISTVGRLQTNSCIRHGKVHGVTINDSLTVTIV
jgi:hypothetical protein